MAHLVLCILVLSLIYIKLLPYVVSEILHCRKDLTLSQLLKLLIAGQVVINSMPLIISITVGFHTALQCENQKYHSFSEVYSAKEAAEMI